MAIFNLVAKAISRRKWPTVVKAAAYISGEKLKSYKEGKVYNYARRQDVLFSKIIAPPGAPEWAEDSEVLWNNTDLTETRWNARLARGFQNALPCELTLGQNIELVENFCRELVQQGAVAHYAIHGAKMKRDQRNTHVHIMATTRVISAEGFGEKIKEWNDKASLYRWRQLWQDLTNSALEKAGLDCRVDCRSHASKGLDLEPMLHLGFKDMAVERAGLQSERGNINREIMARNESRMRQKIAPAIEFKDTENALQQAVKEREAAKTLSDTKSVPEHDLNANLRDIAIEATALGNSVPTIKDETVTVEFMDELPDELQHHAGEYAEILSPDESLNRMLQNQAGLKFLLGLASNAHLSLSERKAELDEFSENVDRRLSKINHIIGLLHDPSTKERFILQEKLERASFNANSNKILAILLEEEKAGNAAKEIRTLFRQSQIEEHQYKKYSNEWHSRSVRDGHYFVFDPKASDIIQQIMAVEHKEWSELLSKSKAFNWTAEELEKEMQRVQDQLDKKLALSFDIKLNFNHDKHRDR